MPPCDLDLWPFDLKHNGCLEVVMDYPYSKFGIDIQTDTQMELKALPTPQAYSYVGTMQYKTSCWSIVTCKNDQSVCLMSGTAQAQAARENLPISICFRYQIDGLSPLLFLALWPLIFSWKWPHRTVSVPNKIWFTFDPYRSSRSRSTSRSNQGHLMCHSL